jgi:hypothetical protein
VETNRNIELKPWQEELKERLDDVPQRREIIWVYDKEGGAGKTMFCDYMEAVWGDQCQVLQPGKGSDVAMILDITKRIYIFDIPKTTGDAMCWGIVEQIKNGRVQCNKYESQVKHFKVPHVVIMSNETHMNQFCENRIEMIIL